MSLIHVRLEPAVMAEDGFSISCRIEADGFPTYLTASVKTLSRTFTPPKSLNWALVALLFPAMTRGLDLHLDGPVCTRLLHDAQNDLQVLLRIFEPSLHLIKVTAKEADVPRRLKGRRAATGFSAGIDSFATISLFPMANSEAAGPRITDLCIFDVGAFGSGSVEEDGIHYENAVNRVMAFASESGCNAVGIRTNFAVFYKGSYNHMKTHSLRNAAAALLMEEEIDYYLYAAAYPFGIIRVAAGDSMAIMDPILLPMISSAATTLISASAGLSRLEKTRMVADMPAAYGRLDVCIAPTERRMQAGYPNCSRCWKCDRTMLTLDILGALDRFDQSFDLAFYRREKQKKLRMTILRAYDGNKIDKEVITAALANGWPVPPQWRVVLRNRIRLQLQPLRTWLKMRRSPPIPLAPSASVGVTPTPEDSSSPTGRR